MGGLLFIRSGDAIQSIWVQGPGAEPGLPGSARRRHAAVGIQLSPLQQGAPAPKAPVELAMAVTVEMQAGRLRVAPHNV